MEISKPSFIEVLTYVLDDDEDYLYLLGTILKENGEHPYKLFSKVDEFMEALDDGKKICIIDYNLHSTVNGIELLKDIKKINPNSYVIMVSCQADINVVTDFYDNDGFRYIPKGAPNLGKRITDAISWAKTTIQRHLDFHFEMIQKFNKTKETIDNARNTLSNKPVGTIP